MSRNNAAMITGTIHRDPHDSMVDHATVPVLPVHLDATVLVLATTTTMHADAAHLNAILVATRVVHAPTTANAPLKSRNPSRNARPRPKWTNIPATNVFPTTIIDTR
jgi:hypothetical protein